MARIQIYRRTYRWHDKDPICDAINAAIEDVGLKSSAVSAVSGVATGTIEGWRTGATRRPQNDTLTSVSGSLGFVRHDHLNKDGTVTPAFERVRDLDWRQEMEKQATWLLKYGTPKQKAQAKKRVARAKKKRNGAA